MILNTVVKDLFEEFNKVAEKSQNIAIFTRDIELQKSEIETLKLFIEKANKLKVNNKTSFTESELNLILFLIINVEAVRFELIMIVNLKENKMDSAWASLIQAQTHISIAASNHPFNSESLKGYVSKLYAYEKILFPKMIFSSIGGIIKKTKCTICGLEYEDCDHVKGKMYNGELCICEIHEIELEEISFVENPANKMCRQLEIEFNGRKVDILTLKDNN